MSEWITTDIYGLESLPLPEGYNPLEAIVAIKCLSSSGHPVLCLRYTKNLTTWESLGMANAMVSQLTNEMTEYFVPYGHSEEENE